MIFFLLLLFKHNFSMRRNFHFLKHLLFFYVAEFNSTTEVQQNFLFEFAMGLVYSRDSRNVITCCQNENMCLIRPTVFDPYPPSAGVLWTPSGRPLRCLFNTSVCDVIFTSLL